MNEVEQYLLSIIPSHPHDAIKMAMEKFNVTRVAIHRQMIKLKMKGLVEQKGLKNKATYHLLKSSPETEKGFHRLTYKVGEKSESEIWSEDIKPLLGKLPANIQAICQHGFTEMFNNIIDHSESSFASVLIQKKHNLIFIKVIDLGIGIFKKVAMACHFDDYREAVIKVHQGKFTTDRSRHSGEGIFFTSRIFDQFVILANGFSYHKDNSEIDDWFFEQQDEKEEKGTAVSMTINLDSKRQLQNIFNQYTNQENFKFDKSHIRISLGKFEEDNIVSRSQARRLLNGLDGFQEIILDFATVKSVGQAFVDEVFGVFSLTHPTVNFIIENANPDIIFMIKRGLANRENLLNKVTFSPKAQKT